MSAFSTLVSQANFTISLLQYTGYSATFLKKYRFGPYLKSLYIFDAKELDQWAVTLSLKDGCFQAYLLVVLIFWLPFPLRHYLRTLANNLGCFPLDIEAYPPMSHWLTKRLSIQSLPWFGTTLAARTKTVALPLRRNINRCASTHFGEIQLAPDSIGISPLTTTHPLFFQQQSVGTST